MCLRAVASRKNGVTREPRQALLGTHIQVVREFYDGDPLVGTIPGETSAKQAAPATIEEKRPALRVRLGFAKDDHRLTRTKTPGQLGRRKPNIADL